MNEATKKAAQAASERLQEQLDVIFRVRGPAFGQAVMGTVVCSQLVLKHKVALTHLAEHCGSVNVEVELGNFVDQVTSLNTCLVQALGIKEPDLEEVLRDAKRLADQAVIPVQK